MKELLKGILMGLAPSEIPKYFTTIYTEEKPREPSHTIQKYSELPVIVNLLASWVRDPCWDLVDTFDSPFQQFPEELTLSTVKQDFAEFESNWNKFWADLAAYNLRRKDCREMKWRKHWANKIMEELENGF